MKFTDAALAVVEKLVETSDRLDAEERELSEQYKRERITGKFFDEQRGEIGRRRDRARLAAQTELADLRRRYGDAAREADRLSGGQLHEDAKLLELDALTLSVDQYAALVDRHRNNPLMAQLLRQYASRRPDFGYDVFNLPPDAARRIELFEQFIDNCATAARDVRGLHVALLLDG